MKCVLRQDHYTAVHDGLMRRVSRKGLIEDVMAAKQVWLTPGATIYPAMEPINKEALTKILRKEGLEQKRQFLKDQIASLEKELEALED